MNFNSLNLHPGASATVELLTHSQVHCSRCWQPELFAHGDVHPATHLITIQNIPFGYYP